ncbi:hypothetical protein QBC38DRAFT_466952 [Podospora fimiseda]|uniref:Superoxide dismutase copper/zinc binding domain-containing protein n=1 Tax=Podospora fimiseda TaxID=252190 RepID=A0AAN7BY94_9PEZI|nr:hypothetical protein QBC38DRAFT_466952 [Podospora fimiseda]
MSMVPGREGDPLFWVYKRGDLPVDFEVLYSKQSVYYCPTVYLLLTIMQLFSLFTLLGAASLGASQSTNVTTGKLGDARQVKNNPIIGETWIATFDSPALQGTVTAVAAKIGINYTIDVTGLDVAKAPYKYHIHLRPVPENGSCADTLGHLDSYVRGDTPPCEGSLPQTCEVGDLSGKYGTLTGPDVKLE